MKQKKNIFLLFLSYVSYSLQKPTFHHSCQMDFHLLNMISECLVVMDTAAILINTKFLLDREASGKNSYL